MLMAVDQPADRPADHPTPAARPRGAGRPGLVARIEARARGLHPVAFPAALGVAGLLGATLLHFVDPNEPGNYPTCPWLLITGTFCPGCGTMRAIALLTHLDLTGAISMNPLLFVLIPYIAWAYGRWVFWSIRPPASPPRMTPPIYLNLMFGLIVLYWVVRNLPFASVLAPGTPLLPGW